MKIFTQKRLAVLIVLHLITFALWGMAKPSLRSITYSPFISLAQIMGLWAATIVSLNFTLAARIKPISQFLGGLDKAYLFHTQTGKLAFFYMLAHPTLLIVSALPNTALALFYIKPFVDLSYDMGKLTLLFFTLLLILTLVIKLPYHIWRRTHQLMIIPMLFLLVHVLIISSDVSVFLPLRVWVTTIITLGIFLYVYKMFIYPFFGPKYLYRIKKVTDLNVATEVILQPLGKRLLYEPGQFVFVQFDSQKVSSEEHPFSVSSSPNKNNLRLSIKKSGDFTNKLGSLKIGEKVKVYGPYGRFGQKIFTSKKPLIFVAGGIGITPFLSILEYLHDQKIDKKITLFYSYSKKEEALYQNQLKKLVSNNISIVFHDSSEKGRINAKSILAASKDKDPLIFLCGPRGMMESLARQFIKQNIKAKNIIFEDFHLKK